ncbi:MAG: MBL fold metallo-hydrolase [Euryarchaeota archaeon]|nr:MBL fold metallo-hydrolase [Euryarchaeota archaeon]
MRSWRDLPKSLRVRILNSDSFGVRSMATVVEVGDLKIMIDPGAALGPYRYGLPPAREEEQALLEAIDLISKEAEDCDVILITHYHYDHYMPEGEFYRGKTLLIKHPSKMINRSQYGRAKKFLEHLKGLGIQPTLTNGGIYEIEKVSLELSPPVPHGPPGTKLGYVLMAYIKDNESGLSFLYTSDVQGPIDSFALEWILSKSPDVVFVDGPPTYLMGYRIPARDIRTGLENLKVIARSAKVLVVDHHMCRDLKYYDYISDIPNAMSAASFMDVEERFLEARRKNLWRHEDWR